MTGPSLAPLIIPIAGTLFLTVWLALVFYAGHHPRRAAGHPAPGHEGPDGARPADTGHSGPQRMEDVRVVWEVER
jgi:hypothetical protein